MATLTITHTENIVLEGRQQGTTKTMRFENIEDIYTRVFSFNQQVATQLYSTHASAVSGSIFDDGNVKYVRITSLNAEPITITVNNESSQEFAVELSQNQSFYLYSHNLGVRAEADAIADADKYNTLVDIDDVEAICGRGPGKVEVFIASTSPNK